MVSGFVSVRIPFLVVLSCALEGWDAESADTKRAFDWVLHVFAVQVQIESQGDLPNFKFASERQFASPRLHPCCTLVGCLRKLPFKQSTPVGGSSLGARAR